MKKISLILLMTLFYILFTTNLNARTPVKECIDKKLKECNGLVLNPKLFHISQERFDRIYRAIEDYEKRCNDKKYGLSCVNLAHMYRTGNTLEENLEKVIEYYTKAYKYGDSKGYRFIAYMYLKGDLVQKDINKAYRYFQMGCKENDKVSCKELNIIKENRQTNKDFKEIEKYEKPCDNGKVINVPYCEKIAAIYERRNNLTKAIKYYKKGCNSIFQNSCSKLGELYISNTQLPKNYIKGINYLKIGCKSGEFKNCVKIGDFYKENLPSDTSYPLSKKYYQKACNLGYKKACDY